MSTAGQTGFDEVKGFIKSMSLMDAARLVKELEEELGVSAAAPVAMVAAVAGGVAPAEEQSEFTLLLEDAGAEKVKVIKAVRELTSLGLKEAKDLVDAAPKPVKEGLSKADAEAGVAKLKEAGAKASMK